MYIICDPKIYCFCWKGSLSDMTPASVFMFGYSYCLATKHDSLRLPHTAEPPVVWVWHNVLLPYTLTPGYLYARAHARLQFLHIPRRWMKLVIKCSGFSYSSWKTLHWFETPCEQIRPQRDPLSLPRVICTWRHLEWKRGFNIIIHMPNTTFLISCSFPFRTSSALPIRPFLIWL